MLRAYARKPTRPDSRPEQTHDDCEWLNEEDGEEDVPWNRRAMDRRLGSPAVGRYQRRRDCREDDARSENCSGDRRHRRRVRRARLTALGIGATRIGLRLGEEVL